MSTTRLTAYLNVNYANFQSGIKKAADSMAGLGKSLLSFQSLAAAVVTPTAFLMFGKNALDLAGNLKDASERLQIGVEDLQRFEYGAKKSGIETQVLESAITRLNSQIAEGNFGYKNATEGLYSIAEAVAQAQTGTEKLAIVNDAFGAKMGAKILPLLLGGAEGLKNLGIEAENAGAVISQKTVFAADELGESLDMMFNTISKNLSGGFMESLTEQSGALSNIYKDPQFADGIKNVGELIGNIASIAIKSAAGIGEFYGKTKELFDLLVDVNMKAAGVSSLKGTVVDPAASLAEIEAKNKKPMQGPPKPPVLPYVPTEETKKRQKEEEDALKAVLNTAEKKSDFTKKMIDDLALESDQLKTQIALFGQKESVISKAQKLLQIENSLRAEGITLSANQREQVEAHLSDIEMQTNRYEDLNEAMKRSEKIGDGLADAFGNFVSDAALGTKSLKDSFQDLGKELQRFILDLTVIDPLKKSIKGFFSGGSSGGGGDILGSLFSSAGKFFGIPSFATGSKYVPRDMMAKVHQGEMIIPRNEVENSVSGGMVYNIDARGADAGVVQKIENVMKQMTQLRNDVPRIAVTSVNEQSKRNPGYLR